MLTLLPFTDLIASPNSNWIPFTFSLNLAVKNFIVEDSLQKVEEPLANKPKVEEPLKGVQIVEKRAIRMIVNRRIKMKKHQRKKLWQRMGLQFRRDRVMREKKKELEFRAILAAKVSLFCVIVAAILSLILSGGSGKKVFRRKICERLLGRFSQGASS